MTVDVLLVVVTYNSKDVINDLLDSVPDAMGALSGAVVVVDNGSQDGTLDELAKRADCALVESSNTGYAAGINRGVREGCASSAILALNPDVVLGPGSIERMFDCLHDTGAGIVAPLVRNADGSTFRSLRREPTLARALGLGRTRRRWFDEYVSEGEAYTFRHPVDWALGAALLVSRECHEALGGWDESYFLYSEETDLCLRASDKGYTTWFEPAAEVMHIGGASGQSATTHVMQVVNRVRLYGRRHASVSTTAYYLASLAGEAARWAKGNPYARSAVRALVQPSLRPPALQANDRVLPS